MTDTLDREILSFDDLLAHHGIKGMHWGIRKSDETGGGSPSTKKEVTPEVQRQRETQAKQYEAKAATYKRQADSLRAKPVPRFYGQQHKDQIKALDRASETATKNAQNKREGKLTEGQKTAIKGAAVAIGILAAYGAYRTLESGQARSALTKGTEFMTRKDFNWKMKPDLSRKGLSHDEIMSKVVKKVNPDFGEYGTKMNCRRCTFAYEMRRRGYDVQATRTSNASGQTAEGLFKALKVSEVTNSKATFAVSNKGEVTQTAFSRLLKNGSVLGENVIRRGEQDGHMGDAIFRSLAQHPEGARGELGVAWSTGGAHSVAWEIVGGKPVVFDCQTGKSFKNAVDLFSGGPIVSAAGFTRLDNLPVNNEFLRRWVKNAG